MPAQHVVCDHYLGLAFENDHSKQNLFRRSNHRFDLRKLARSISQLLMEKSSLHKSLKEHLSALLR